MMNMNILEKIIDDKLIYMRTEELEELLKVVLEENVSAYLSMNIIDELKDRDLERYNEFKKEFLEG